MQLCPQCGREVQLGDRRCLHCGLSLANVRAVEEVADRRHDRNRRKRWIGHGITGIVVVAAVGFLTSPFSPLTNLLFAGMVGFPMGFLISYLNAGSHKGMLIGTLVCAGFYQIAILLAGGGISPMTLFGGAIGGAIPGYLIGLHCELDR